MNQGQHSARQAISCLGQRQHMGERWQDVLLAWFPKKGRADLLTCLFITTHCYHYD